MTQANEISNTASSATIYSFLKNGLIGQFQLLTKDQVEILSLAIDDAYMIPAQPNQRPKANAVNMLEIRKNQLKEAQEKQEKIVERNRTFFLGLVGLLFVSFVGIIVCFKSTSLAISEGGDVRTIEPKFWDLFSGWFGIGVIAATFASHITNSYDKSKVE